MNSKPSPKNGQLTMLALGDSYTIGESVEELQRWPEQLVRQLNLRGYNFAKPRIIATTGWRTDDLSRAIDAAKIDDKFDLVSLLIGVNNQYQGKDINSYESEFRALLERAISFAGGDPSKVIVLSIPDYGYTPFGRDKQEQISRELDEYNRINKEVAQSKQVQYVDITPISRRGLDEPELVARDGLHPSGKMYALWVEKVIEVIGSEYPEIK